jgi:hypothetical protein
MMSSMKDISDTELAPPKSRCDSFTLFYRQAAAGSGVFRLHDDDGAAR